MAERIFSIPQKLQAVERLIEEFRWARDDYSVPENRTYFVLKAIADDLRGRLPGAPGEALRGLEEIINAAKQTKIRNGYEIGHLRRIAEYVIGCWPTLRQALEKFQPGGTMTEEPERTPGGRPLPEDLPGAGGGADAGPAAASGGNAAAGAWRT
jgi:hypothetical protein